jgi:hypothetical protein
MKDCTTLAEPLAPKVSKATTHPHAATHKYDDLWASSSEEAVATRIGDTGPSAGAAAA